MESTFSNDNDFSFSMNLKPIFLIVGVIILLASIFYFYLMQTSSAATEVIDESYYFEYYDDLTPAQIKIIEVVSKHAYEKHADEVDKAFKCLKDNGSTKSFRTFGMKNKDGSDVPSISWLCFDGKDWYSIVTTLFNKIGNDKVARLFTAYAVDKVDYPTIEKYIEYLSADWSAKLSNYVFNPGYFRVVFKFR